MFRLLLVFNGMDVWEWLDLLLVIQWNEWMDEWIEFKIRGAWSNVDFLCQWIDSQDVWMDSQTCE